MFYIAVVHGKIKHSRLFQWYTQTLINSVSVLFDGYLNFLEFFRKIKKWSYYSMSN